VLTASWSGLVCLLLPLELLLAATAFTRAESVGILLRCLSADRYSQLLQQLKDVCAQFQLTQPHVVYARYTMLQLHSVLLALQLLVLHSVTLAVQCRCLAARSRHPSSCRCILAHCLQHCATSAAVQSCHRALLLCIARSTYTLQPLHQYSPVNCTAWMSN
jgi:hypothetical protein